MLITLTIHSKLILLTQVIGLIIISNVGTLHTMEIATAKKEQSYKVQLQLILREMLSHMLICAQRHLTLVSY